MLGFWVYEFGLGLVYCSEWVCLFACDVLGGLLAMILGSFLLGLTLGVVYVNCLVILWLVWWGELYFV